MKRAIYAGPAVVELVRQLGGTLAEGEDTVGLSPAVNFAAGGWLAMVRRHTPALARDDWGAIFEAMNGVAPIMHLDPETAERIPAALIGNVADFAARQSNWDIDPAALTAELAAMPWAEQAAIWHLAARFWATEGAEIEDIVPKGKIIQQQEQVMPIYKVKGERFERLEDARKAAEQIMAGLHDDDYVMIDRQQEGEDFFEPYKRVEREGARFVMR